MDTIKLKTSSVSDAEALFAAARDVRMIPTKRQTAAYFSSEASYEEEHGSYFKKSGGVFIKSGTFLEHDLTIVAKKHSNLGVAWVELTFHLSTFGTHAEVLQWLAAAFGAASCLLLTVAALRALTCAWISRSRGKHFFRRYL